MLWLHLQAEGRSGDPMFLTFVTFVDAAGTTCGAFRDVVLGTWGEVVSKISGSCAGWEMK